MAKRDDDSENYQEKPRPRPPRDESIQPEKPRPAKPPPDDWDDEPDKPRRRGARPPVRRRHDDNAVSTLIPYRNAMALAAYYTGLFGIIPVLGLILGPLGFIFGIVGLRKVGRNPEIKGTGHAIAGIVLGGIGGFYNWGIVILIFVAFWTSRR